MQPFFQLYIIGYTPLCCREGKWGYRYFFDTVKVWEGPPSIFQFNPVICPFTETASKQRSNSHTVKVCVIFKKCARCSAYFKNAFKRGFSALFAPGKRRTNNICSMCTFKCPTLKRTSLFFLISPLGLGRCKSSSELWCGPNSGPL